MTTANVGKIVLSTGVSGRDVEEPLHGLGLGKLV